MADGEFSSPTNIVWGGSGGHVGTVEYGGGAQGLVVFFYNKSAHNKQASLQAGRPVYGDQVFVRIAPPGEKLNVVDRPANGGDARRWPTQWNQFQQNKQQTIEGTPIDLLYPDNPSIGATMRASGVYTIEQCAELSAHAIESVGMGAQTWVNAAKKYMTAANKGVNLTQYRHDLDERDREVGFLKKQIDELMFEIQKLRNENQVRGNLALQSLVAASLPIPTPAMDAQARNYRDLREQGNITARSDEIRKPNRRQRPKLDQG